MLIEKYSVDFEWEIILFVVMLDLLIDSGPRLYKPLQIATMYVYNY